MLILGLALWLSPQLHAQDAASPLESPLAAETPATDETPVADATGVDWAQFDAYVQQALTEFGVPGAAVVVVADDAVVYSQGYGVRKLGEDAPVDENTRFPLADVSKFLLASASGALVDGGKVAWDKPIVTYLPTFALADDYVTANTTLRDLLVHRTGLPTNTGDLIGNLGYDGAEVLARLPNLPLIGSFRDRQRYSSLGYFVAGEVLGAADGKPWAEVMADRIFTPLGMERSSGDYGTLTADENVAYPHIEPAEELTATAGLTGTAVLTVTTWETASTLGAAGQMVSTGADLGRWLRMLLNGGRLEEQNLLNSDTVDEIFRPTMVGGNGGTLGDLFGARCLGCDTYRYLQDRIVEKEGTGVGMRTLVALAPDRKLGIAILANRNLTYFPEAVRDRFFELALGSAPSDLHAANLAQQTRWELLRSAPTPPVTALEPSLPLVDYAGDYTNALYGTFVISATEDALQVAAGPAGYPGTLTPYDGDVFLLTWPNVNADANQVTFVFNADGEVESLQTGAFGEFIRER